MLCSQIIIFNNKHANMYTLYMAINTTNVKIKVFLPIQIHFNMGKKENWGSCTTLWDSDLSSSKKWTKKDIHILHASTCFTYLEHISVTYFIFNGLSDGNNTGNMLVLEHQWLANNSCLGPPRSMNSVPKYLIQISSLCFKNLSMLHLCNADILL